MEKSGEGSAVKQAAGINLGDPESRFYLLVDAHPDAIVVVDKEGVIQYVNSAARDLFGLESSELVGSMFGFPLSCEDKTDVDILRKGGERGYAEMRVVQADWFGKEAYVASLRDITDRKRAEEALRDSEKQLESIIEFLPDATFVVDKEGKVVAWNRAMRDLTGFCASDMVGKSSYEYAIPFYGEPRPTLVNLVIGDPNASQDFFPQCSIDNSTITWENFSASLRPGGAYIWAKATPLYDSQGNVIGGIETIRDITERKLAEQEIDRLRHQLELILNGAGEGIFGFDRQGNLTFSNPASCFMLGYSPEELAGAPVKQLLRRGEPAGQDSSDDDLRVLRAMALGIAVEVNDEVFWRKDGTSFPAEYVCSPLIDDHQEIVGAVVVFRDITERKRSQEELARQARELERSNRELEQFAYVASHDLQEPLRMVASYTQLLAKRYKGRLGQDADEFIEYAVDGANRLSRLINDLLAYSRVGTRGGEFEPVDMSDILQRVLSNLRVMLTETAAEVEVGHLPAIVADPTQMEQLFQNLVSNAVKFRLSDTPRVEITAEKDGTDWIFKVEDNGIGIPREFQERIFIIFQRLHTAAEYSGSGIGLSICKKIVERHGGRIWVESEPGHGSRFYVSLPENGGAG